ncbi:MAG: FecR family protein [Agriterribacter sp.]
MSRNRLIELLVKRDAREITLLEQKELSDLIKNDQELAAVAHAFDLLNDQDFTFNERERSNSERRWLSLEKKLEPDEGYNSSPKHRLLYVKKWMAAASVMIVIALGTALLINQYNTQADNETKNMVATKRGSKSYLELPDGTKVWLNSASKIWYEKSFGSHNREITLSGEAYFDVVKNTDKPFIVHTNELDVIALGTAFNVSAYQNNGSTETTLIRGSIEVALKKHSGKKILLKPFEKISVQNKDARQQQPDASLQSQIYSLSKVKKEEDNGEAGSPEMQWTKNKLAFDNATLDEIARQLSLWYDVDIQIVDTSLKEKRFNAVFDNVSLQEVMQSLQLTGGFNYSLKDKTITIMP